MMSPHTDEEERRLVHLMQELGMLDVNQVVHPTQEELDELEDVLVRGYTKHVEAHGACSQREFVYHCLRSVLLAPVQDKDNY